MNYPPSGVNQRQCFVCRDVTLSESAAHKWRDVRTRTAWDVGETSLCRARALGKSSPGSTSVAPRACVGVSSRRVGEADLEAGRTDRCASGWRRRRRRLHSWAAAAGCGFWGAAKQDRVTMNVEARGKALWAMPRRRYLGLPTVQGCVAIVFSSGAADLCALFFFFFAMRLIF